MIDDSRLNNILIHLLFHSQLFLFSGKNVFKLQTDLLNVLY